MAELVSFETKNSNSQWVKSPLSLIQPLSVEDLDFDLYSTSQNQFDRYTYSLVEWGSLCSSLRAPPVLV